MIQATACVVVGQWFDRVQQLLGDPPDPARWRWALTVAAAVLALVPSAAQSKAPVMPVAAMEAPSDAPETDVAKPSLPPRALLRIGTDDLRTQSFINAFAFSPDGRLVAAADSNAPSPRVVIFDVRTGQQVKQLVASGNRGGSIASVAFSPDGTKLLWGEYGGEVALSDLSGDRLLFREKLHGGAINDVEFSPDGSMMASAGGDLIRLRRVAKPARVVRDLTTPPGPAPAGLDAPKVARPDFGGREGFACLAFTPDGTRVVAGSSYDATVFIWQIQDGRLLRTIPSAHGNPVTMHMNPSLNCAAVTPDGRRIMSVGQTTKPIEQTKLQYGSKNVTMSEVRFWDIATGQRVADYHGDEDFGFGFGALSRDGRRVAMADFSRLRILDAATGRAEQTIALPGSWGRRPAFSPDGTLVAMPIDNTIGLFEVSTGRRLHHDESTPVGFVVSAAWSPSGDRLVIGNADGFVRVWDAATGKLIWHKLLAPVISRSGWNAHPAFVSFSRDGKLVVAAGQRDDPVKYDHGIVAIYEAASGRTVRESFQKEIRWAALAPDGRMVVVATSHGSRGDTHFIGIDVATGRTRWANPPVDQRAGFYPLVGMQFKARSPFFGAALKDGTVIRLNSLTGHEQGRFLAEWRTPEEQKAERPREPNMWEATFSADGRTLISSVKEWLYVWDVESGTLGRKIRGPHQQSYNLALAPDGRTLATSDLRYIDNPGKDTIRLFDIETGEQILTLEPGDSRPAVMVFSPDGKRLFTGFGRGSGIVWDVGRGQGAPRAKE
ncbi:MAG: WD40 repeat domain-containing protein [Isosphaerales bacterium]